MKIPPIRRRPVPAALALTAGLALGAYGAVHAVHEVTNPTPTFKMADPHEAPSHSSFAPIVKKALPAVVNISSSKVVRTPGGMSGGMPMDPFFQQFFGPEFGRRSNIPRERREQSLGSGVIISPEGYIVTNNHVVDGASDVKVTLSDKREFKARVVGTDPKSDIAVLKIDASNLPCITLGDSSKVEVGDYVLAIGDPFGVGQTVTMGIVSATGRGGLGIEDYEDFIQTDAPINPGNSGGALINDRGELVGINTAILSKGDGGNEGIGFAIPVNLAHQVMTALIQHGHVIRAYLGILPQDLTPEMAKAFGTNDTRGALVGDVTPNSPASRSGLQKGDIIRDVNGKPVTDSNELRNNIAMMQPDSHVKLDVLRNGKQQTFDVTLAQMPGRQEQASNHAPDQNALDGVNVENSQDGPGVVVTNVDPASQAADAGLQPGDVIQEVNRQPVKNVQDYQRALRHGGKDPLLLVNRQGNTLFIAA